MGRCKSDLQCINQPWYTSRGECKRNSQPKASDTQRTDVLQDALEEGPSTATHFDGCEKYHHACALAQLTALRARLDAANMEIAAKTDLWRRETARAQASERGAARCREWADAIHRYGKEGKDSAMVAVITEMSLWAQANAAKKGGRDAA